MTEFWDLNRAPMLTPVEEMLAFCLGLQIEDVEIIKSSMPNGLLVGEQPSPNSSSSCPLFPYPLRSSGGRLWRWSNIPVIEYLARIRRINLLHRYAKRWSPAEARDRAVQLLSRSRPEKILVCGRRAANAFGVPEWFGPIVTTGVEIRAIPHPSPRNVFYNEPLNRERAGDALRWLAGQEV